MTDIIKEIETKIPKEKIKEAMFEGANIVLYTDDKSFFLNDGGAIRRAVNHVKKRIELRPSPSLLLEEEHAEKKIRQILGEESKIGQIIFDKPRSQVIIEVEKPGVAIGKQGENLQSIREETLWVPLIKRTPAIRSELIENIRSVLYQNSDYRRKFLHKTGQRIYNGWLRQKKEEWVRITHLGAARQVGRSCILLQTPESRVLLDCGLDTTSEQAAYPYVEVPEFNIQELDAVVITHAHLDHVGFLPYLFKFGYKGPVYCTAPTRDIMALLQLDLVKIQRMEGKEPIYTSEEIKEMVKHTITLDYEEVTDITPDVRITLYNAGHVLGSAIVHIHIGNGLHNLVYTGDIKYAKTAMLAPANTSFPRCETLILESTYGGKDNVLPPVKEQDEAFCQVIEETIKRGGKVLMPVLGSGRAQEVVVILENMIRSGRLDPIPIYIDGMVWDIMAIHTAYPEFLNSTVRQQIFHKDNNPFLAENIKRVGSNKERQQLIEEGGPCLILATSGMMEGGPSVQYFRKLADNPKNSLIFSCFLPEGSLGKRIQRGATEISFQDGAKIETVPVRLEVHKLEISGHADRRELMNYVRRVNPKPKKIILNHGEASRILDLARSIHKTYRIETAAPRNIDAIRLC
ncbi:beta-CASP ribonuclease aCPSF1 [Candidatus Woesearchaeota archaeon]|nr:MAG: beta-CASP ribonuclease aCPSF1 [Candidatus Woesearchaeota archaeon]